MAVTFVLLGVAISLILAIAASLRRRERGAGAEAQLRTTEESFRLLVDGVRDYSIVMLDTDGRVASWNTGAARTEGYRQEEIIGSHFSRFYPVEEIEGGGPGRHLLEARVHGHTRHEGWRVRSDGSRFWADVAITALREDGDGLKGYAEVTHDITERRRAEKQLRASTELVQGIIHNSPAVIFVKDIAGRYQLVNAEFEKVVSLDNEHILGKTDFDLFPPATAREFTTGDQQVIEQGNSVDLESVVHLPDRVLTFVTTLFPLRNNGDEVHAVAGISTDITERKEAETRLSHLATHDTLTGLPNRTLFLDRLRLALARTKRHAEPVAVLFLDIDRFKAINDRLGHEAGDQMLITLADRLKEVVRPSDTIARFGGDEFAMLCEDLTSDHDAVLIAERALEAISAPLTLGAREMHVTPSIGIATAASADAPETLLRNADMAMYQAKEGSKARYEVFDEGMRDGLLKRLRTEQELRHALTDGGLLVLYQPILSVSERRVVGVEALARWDHPHRGVLLPAEFIAIAEETGLILPLGDRILEEACRQAAEWRDRLSHDVAPVVTINLSASQLDQPDLVDRVAEVIDITGAAAESLHLEITETALMEDVAASGAALAKLKSLGVSIDIDDFGTGYSSLGYLQRLPVDRLKIDRSFVGQLGASAAASGIVTAVISLAHALHIPAIAEGVETEDQLSELAALGCDLAQGHLFHPALPPGEVERILT